jgi:hypothetical protein
LRAIAVKHKGKKSIDIWLTSIPASLCSAKGVIDEYRNRWGVEVFFKEEFGRMQSCISMRMDLS